MQTNAEDSFAIEQIGQCKVAEGMSSSLDGAPVRSAEDLGDIVGAVGEFSSLMVGVASFRILFWVVWSSL